MKRLCVIFLCVFLLTGCAAKEEDPIYRVVTGIDVEYQQKDNTIVRTYNQPTSLESILTYIRILKPYGPVIPDEDCDSTCKITLHYSSGPDCVYIQRGGQYLQKDGGDWKTVDTSRASLLYPLLLLLPSDS